MDKSTSEIGYKFCVSLDGSKYSEFGLDLTSLELFKKENDLLMAVHVKHLNQKSLPFNLQCENISSYATSKLVGKFMKDKYYVILQEPDKTYTHPLNQIHDYCVKNNVDYLIVGFHGTTENKKKDDITSGIMYLIKQIHIPCIIVKEFIPRDKKKNKGYVWLACIDTHLSRGWKALLKSFPLMKEEDELICLHLTSNDNEKKLVETEFYKLCKEFNIKKNKMNLAPFNSKQSIAQQIIEQVNFCDNAPDFIVLGHNSQKYDINSINQTPCVEIIRKAYTNIVFHS